MDEVKIEILEIEAKQVETGSGVKEEIIECIDVLYLQRDRVLEEREEVSITKVRHGETGHEHDAIGCVELGGNQGPGVSWSAQCAECECN